MIAIFYLATIAIGLPVADGAAKDGFNTKALERGHVIVHKNIDAEYLVQGHPFDVIYSVMNIGEEVAYNVFVADPYPDLFTVVKGTFNSATATFNIDLPELASGANFTSVLRLVPKVSGIMKVARAEVRYKWVPPEEILPELDEEGGGGGKSKAAIDELAEEQISLSTSREEVEILSPEKFARVSKNRLPSVLATALCAALAILYPLYMHRMAVRTASASNKIN